MSLNDVLETPKKHFFWLLGEIDRHRAESDLRQYRVVQAVNSAEGSEKLTKELYEDRGQLLHFGRVLSRKIEIETDDGKIDPEFDRAGLRALKAKMGV